MIVKTIEDTKAGRKWEIVKRKEDFYSVKYYEFYDGAGWRFLFEGGDYSKDYIEFEFDTVVA